MGVFTSKQRDPIDVDAPGLRVFKGGRVLDEAVTLRLKEKIWSFDNDSYDIECVETQEPVFQLKGNEFALRERKAFNDAQSGEDVFAMKDHVLGRPTLQQVFDARVDGRPELFEIRASTNTFLPTGKLRATVKNLADGSGELIELTLKAGMTAKTGTLYVGRGSNFGVPIAQISQLSESALTLPLSEDEYLVKVAARVDLALVLAFCVAWDELKTDTKPCCC